MKKVLRLGVAGAAALALSGCLLMERADIHITLKSPTVIAVAMNGVAVNPTMLEQKAAGKQMNEVSGFAETRDLLMMMAGEDALRRLDHIDGARFAVETSGDMTSKSKRFAIFELATSQYGPYKSHTIWVVSVPKVDPMALKAYKTFDVSLSGRLCATPLPKMVLVPNLPITLEKIRLDGADAWCLPLDEKSLSADRQIVFYYPNETKWQEENQGGGQSAL